MFLRASSRNFVAYRVFTKLAEMTGSITAVVSSSRTAVVKSGKEYFFSLPERYLPVFTIQLL